jgi:lipooligosaccharide transport system permease protein
VIGAGRRGGRRPLVVRSRRGRRLFERNLVYYRAQWRVLLSGAFEPLFYLVSVGYGLGALLGDVEHGGRTVSYAAYVAPGLAASAAMNGAIYDATMNVFHKLRYAKVYDAALATPLSPADIAAGEISWALFRGVLYSLGFLAVAGAGGLVGSAWALLVPFGAALVGFGFAAVAMGVSTYLRSWADFAWVHVVTTPLFLFSATFFPLSTYPRPLQLVVAAFPLYHGVELLRGLLGGDVHLGLLGHAAYFVAMGLAGLALVQARLEALLVR